MYRHILVPIDGSELTTSLVAQAVEFARSHGARITFFTMIEDYGATQDGALMRTLSPEEFENKLKQRASNVISKALAVGQAMELVCEGVVRIGTSGMEAYEEILRVAEEKACDLIYMASHGRRGLKALALGSQTYKVLTHTHLPVFVAKAKPPR